MKTVIRVTVVAGLVMAALSGVSHANDWNVDGIALIGSVANESGGWTVGPKNDADINLDGEPTAYFDHEPTANEVQDAFRAGWKDGTISKPASLVIAPATTIPATALTPAAKPAVVVQHPTADAHNYVWSAKQAENRELTRVAQLKQVMLTSKKYAEVKQEQTVTHTDTLLTAAPAEPTAPTVVQKVTKTEELTPTAVAKYETPKEPVKAPVTAPEATTPKATQSQPEAQKAPQKAAQPAKATTSEQMQEPEKAQTAAVVDSQWQQQAEQAVNGNTDAINSLIDAHNENVGVLDNHEGRINSLESHDKAQDKAIKQNNKRAMAGIASALAQTGLHYTDSANSLAAGAGNYSGESAISVGYSHQWGNNVRFSVQNSVDTAHRVGTSASVAIGW